MTISIQNRLTDINLAHSSFMNFIANYQVDDALIQKMNIIIDEVLSNIIQYGYDAKKNHTIHIDFEIENNILAIKFSDDGRPFNPLQIEAPDLNVQEDQLESGGLGIHLMKNLADEIDYIRDKGCNHLVVKKSVL